MKVFVSYSFVTDLRGRNILHANCCPATCSLKNQSLPLLLWRPDIVHSFGGNLAHSKVIWGNYCEDRRDMLSIGRSSSSRVGMLASVHVEIAGAYLSELMEMMHSMACV